MAQDFLAALDTEIAELEAELSADVRFVRLHQLRKTRSLYVDPEAMAAEMRSLGARVISPGNVQYGQSHGDTQRAAASRPLGRRASVEKAQALDAVALHLANRSGPVPTRELLDHLHDLGIEISGASPLNNLSAMLSNSDRFYSHGRTGWTLLIDPKDALDLASNKYENVYADCSKEYIGNMVIEKMKEIHDHIEFNTELPDEVKNELSRLYKISTGEDYIANTGKFQRAFIVELNTTVEKLKKQNYYPA